MIYKIVPFHAVEDIIRDFVERKHIPSMLDDEPVSVDWDYYRLVSEAGAGAVVLAIDDSGLCGIAGYQLSENPNNKGEITAENVILSVDKEKSVNTGEFLKEANRLLKEAGAAKVVFTVKNDKVGRFLSMNGYEKESTVYGVEL